MKHFFIFLAVLFFSANAIGKPPEFVHKKPVFVYTGPPDTIRFITPTSIFDCSGTLNYMGIMPTSQDNGNHVFFENATCTAKYNLDLHAQYVFMHKYFKSMPISYSINNELVAVDRDCFISLKTGLGVQKRTTVVLACD